MRRPSATTPTRCWNDVNPPFWDGNAHQPAADLRLGQPHRRARRRNQRYPGWLNINRTQDVAISMTKVAGRHTIKAGFYNNHSYKAQNIGRRRCVPGQVNFGNDTNNPLDTGFGYANAALGVFTPVHAGARSSSKAA